MTGTKGLQERGIENFEDYGALPCTATERKDLAARVRLLLNQNFSAFIRENSQGIRHVPGFWIDGKGDANLWHTQDFPHPLLLVPYRKQPGWQDSSLSDTLYGRVKVQ